MSWLYTILFAGLVASQGETVPPPVSLVPGPPAVVQTQTQDVSERFEQTYPLTASGRLRLSNMNGSVTLEAWDRNEVKLQYVKTADSKERLSQMQVRIEPRADSLTIVADNVEWQINGETKVWAKQCCKHQVDFRLMVPRNANLSEIETRNGSITLSNFTNYAKISAVNGGIRATNIRGTANLSTMNGEVSAEFDRLDSASKISLESVNGRANLVIPSDANATLKASSLNGPISNDLGLPVRKGKYIGSDLYGQIGNGDVQIKLGTVNGPVSITRKADGKAAAPVTDLLDQLKIDSDEDLNAQVTAAVKSGKIDKQAEKSAKSAVKDLKVDPRYKGVPVAEAKTSSELPEPPIKVNIAPIISQVTIDSLQRSADILAKAIEADEARKIRESVREQVRQRQELMPKLVEANFNTSLPRIEKQGGSFQIKGIPIVTVEAGDCGVKVQGWDKQEIQYRLVRISDARSRGTLKISEDHTDGSVNLRVGGTERSRSRAFLNEFAQARLEVFVPKRANLQIEADGEIRIEGLNGNIEITGGDEAVNVRDVSGNLHVTNSDGHVRVVGFKGEIVAETKDGMINLEGDFSRLKATSTDGAVTLTVPDNTSADLVSNCDQVRADGIGLTTVGHENDRTQYRIGKGGARFEVTTDAEIHVRALGVLK